MNNSNNAILVKRATFFAVIVAGVSILIKLIAWFSTNSLTILASLFDSTLDIASSLVNMMAVYYAVQPPDNEHRFGHEKAEDLAVLTQSIFFAISGIIVIFSAVNKFFHIEAISEGHTGMILIFFSIMLNFVLILYQKYVIKKTNSSVIKADNFHYVIDLITNLVTILAIALSTYFSFHYADPIFAIFIAIYILYGSWGLLKGAFKNLMDHELSDSEKELIKQIITSDQRIIGFHDLKTRLAGNKSFIQFHMVLDPKIILLDAHYIAVDIETKILEKMPNAEIMIHQDPDGIEEEIEYKD